MKEGEELKILKCSSSLLSKIPQQQQQQQPITTNSSSSLLLLTCTPPPPLHPNPPTYKPKKNLQFPPQKKSPFFRYKFPATIIIYDSNRSPTMGPIVLTQLATGLSVLAGAVIVKQVMDENPMMGSGRAPRCPSCNGTGRVACMCTRWSDGDFGCRTCAGSGRMGCSSCGGSGTGRPLPLQISVRPPPPTNRSS